MSEKVGNAKGTQLDEEFMDLEKVFFHTVPVDKLR